VPAQVCVNRPEGEQLFQPTVFRSLYYTNRDSTVASGFKKCEDTLAVTVLIECAYISKRHLAYHKKKTI
jgi:hypothetical protein